MRGHDADDPSWWPLADGSDPRSDIVLAEALERRVGTDRAAALYLETLHGAMAGDVVMQLSMARLLQAGVEIAGQPGRLAIEADPSRALFWFARVGARADCAESREARSEGETLLRHLRRRNLRFDEDAAAAPLFFIVGEPGYRVTLMGSEYQLVLHAGGQVTGIGSSPSSDRFVQGAWAQMQAMGFMDLWGPQFLGMNKQMQLQVTGSWQAWRRAPDVGPLDSIPAIDLNIVQHLNYLGNQQPHQFCFANGKWRDRRWRFFILGRSSGRFFQSNGACSPLQLYARDDEGLCYEFKFGS
jgi:hypothetical protein